MLKQAQRFRFALQALELAMSSGNAAALDDLIKLPSEARSGWQIGGAGSAGNRGQ